MEKLDNLVAWLHASAELFVHKGKITWDIIVAISVQFTSICYIIVESVYLTLRLAID